MSIDISNSDIALFQSQDRLELLNDIDKFRQEGLANLPQIVVCGDTSSGKSSVLEALSGIPFPVDGGICTRFATEIALRYATNERVTGEAFITPAPGASESHRASLASFPRAITSLEAIPGIMQNAKELMGLGKAAGISRDVLHLKLHGNSLPNLTLIDLPGLIHAATHSDDVTKVQSLVEHYFKQEESLILNIVSAENPIQNQVILTLSQQYDPMGARSIGVITKPDVLQRPDKARLTNDVIELAKNQHTRFKFKRGWQIIRCLTDDERQGQADRDNIETDLFRQRPWNTFDRKRLGTKSLRSVLCEHLEEHIVRLLPGLSKSLDMRVTSVKSALQELGPHRATHNERMQYLIRLSRRYGQIVNDALTGDYSDSFFHGSEPATRLRATTMTLADDFEQAMRTQGHMFEITTSRANSQVPDMPQQMSTGDALTKVAKLMESFRGPELPLLLNPRLVGELFKEQSQKWPAMASDYTHRICRVIRGFLRMAIDSMCPSTGRTTELILRHIFDDAVHSHQQKLDQKIRELFAPYTGPFLFSTRRRLQTSMDEVELELSRGAKNNGQDTCMKLLHCSIAYYNVSLETFIDNVVVLGVESCLLTKLEEMFSPETVAQMTEEMMQLLGGESSDIVTERRDLMAQLETLEKALKNCRRHASREFGFGRETVPVPTQESETKDSTTPSSTHEQSNSGPVELGDMKQTLVRSSPELVALPVAEPRKQSLRPAFAPKTSAPNSATPSVIEEMKTVNTPASTKTAKKDLEDLGGSQGNAISNNVTYEIPSAGILNLGSPSTPSTKKPGSLFGNSLGLGSSPGFGSEHSNPFPGPTSNSTGSFGHGRSSFGSSQTSGAGSILGTPGPPPSFQLARSESGGTAGQAKLRDPQPSVAEHKSSLLDKSLPKLTFDRQRIFLPHVSKEEASSAKIAWRLPLDLGSSSTNELVNFDERFMCDRRTYKQWTFDPRNPGYSFEELRLNVYNEIWTQNTKKVVASWLSRQTTEREASCYARGYCDYPTYMDFVEKAVTAGRA